MEFTNGENGIYDCLPILDFGVFKELKDLSYFKQAQVLDGAVVWPNDQDICPGDEDCGGYTLEESDIKSTLPKKVKLYEGMSVADKFKALM